jgi:hypothetical protein
MGDIEILPPRPEGRSGCVRTAPTDTPGASIRARSVGTEKSGVPKKRTFISLRALFELVAIFGAPPSEKLLFEATEMVYEKYSIEVVHLVLNAERD